MEEIITERSGSILRIELNRPKKRNALTSSMYASDEPQLQDDDETLQRLSGSLEQEQSNGDRAN